MCSSLVSPPASTPGAVIWHWFNNTFELVISAGILAEFERTLAKPYYRSRRSPAQIEAAGHQIGSRQRGVSGSSH